MMQATESMSFDVRSAGAEKRRQTVLITSTRLRQTEPRPRLLCRDLKSRLLTQDPFECNLPTRELLHGLTPGRAFQILTSHSSRHIPAMVCTRPGVQSHSLNQDLYQAVFQSNWMSTAVKSSCGLPVVICWNNRSRVEFG